MKKKNYGYGTYAINGKLYDPDGKLITNPSSWYQQRREQYEKDHKIGKYKVETKSTTTNAKKSRRKSDSGIDFDYVRKHKRCRTESEALTRWMLTGH